MLTLLLLLNAFLGTFAVVSLMLSSSVYSTNSVVKRDLPVNLTNFTETSIEYWPPTHLEIVTTLAMAVGLWQVRMTLKHFYNLLLFVNSIPFFFL